MVREVLQAGLYAPIVFAGHEDERIGGADLRCQRLQGGGAEPGAYSLYMRSSIGSPIGLRVDEFDLAAARLQAGDM